MGDEEADSLRQLLAEIPDVDQRDEAKRRFKDRFGMPDRLPSARYHEALAYATELTALEQGTGEEPTDD